MPSDCTVVRQGALALSFTADGVLEPVDPLPVRFGLQRYSGPLKVARAVSNGSRVVAGDVLLAIDTASVDRQVAAAESTLTVAQAAVAKAESDLALGDRGDALAMDTARQSAADAVAGLKRYDQTDGPAAVTAAGLQAKEVDAALDDATDELNQLRQMYKTEDLTNQTADIVLKRAVRQQDVYRTMDRLAQVTADRATTFEPAVRRHGMAASVAAEGLSIDVLAASQAQARVGRAASLTAARAAADDAGRTVAELKQDRASLTVTSPVAGLVVYGAFVDRAWQPVEADKLGAGRKVQPGEVLMTVYRPGHLRVAVACEQSRWQLMPAGTAVTVRPEAVPGVTYAGTCEAAVPVVTGGKPDATLGVPVSLPMVDGRLAPGMYAAVDVDVPPAAGVLLVPVTAVYHGRVRVRHADGTTEPRPVEIGRRTDKQVEVRSGLTDGEVVQTRYDDGR